MKKFLVLLILVVISIPLQAQEYKMGEVTKEELQEEKCSFDEDASAAILYSHRESYIFATSNSVSLITEIYKKIKIYDTEGFDYATEIINLYKSRSVKEQVSKIKAVTYNLEGDKIVETKLDKDQIFENEASFRYDKTSFTLPNVKVGSVIEISYKINSPYYSSFDDVIFQYDIPVKKFYAEIRTPEVFKYNRTFKGFVPVHVTTEKKLDHRLGLDVDVYMYTQENIPALKEEPNVDNMNNYRGAIVYELAQEEWPTYFRSYAQTWGDVAKEIANEEDYKEDLDKARFVDDITDPLINGISDPKVKMQKIFDYVKSEYTWNGYEGKYFYNGLKKTIKEKKGNVADINLLLVAMLRYAGVDANPVIISTKDNMIPVFPTIKGLNYVIAHVLIDKEEFVLDATDEFSQINLLPLNDYNWEGMYINNNKKLWTKISLVEPEPSVVNINMMCTLEEDGTAEGKMRFVLNNHSAMNFRKAYKDANEEDFIRDQENRLHDIEISDFKVANAQASNKSVMESFSFYAEDAAELIGDKLYVNPMMFLTQDENPYVSEKREYPIYFGYPKETKCTITMTIPQGYHVEYAPQSQIVQLPEDLGEVKYLIKDQGNVLQIAYDLKINKAQISQFYYDYLKGFFSKMVEIESEKIILSKV
ncbi:DUF3857 domain-containing protein [Neptunitalea lumnitzerae]|uniref:DUF3857 domain-containing protein n=1 Tax=Neptunitalea lumnitzerae TaxID=2965509 RepID=A0ABQ5MI16_9FLAO|nr:transglutaminase domain-containing protein [Neptunitalea sp. Y10]GLB49066.1 hypothetical protein Y10_14340 [Neptunitalea sp. Y10]